MKLNFGTVSALVVSAFVVLSVGDSFAMNRSLNIIKNQSDKEQRILNKVNEELKGYMAWSSEVSMDEAICRVLEDCPCSTYGYVPDEVRGVIMSHWPKINAGSPYGRSALGAAIRDGNLKLTKYLVENGAETTHMDVSRRTAAMRAIQYSHPDIAIYLIERGYGYDWYKERWSTDTVMLQAIDKGYYEVVKCLVEHGANVDLSNKYGDTPLKRAVRKGYIDMAEYLIKRGGASVPTDASSLIEEGVRSVKWRLECLLKK